MKILTVDDEPQNLDLLEVLLRGHGYEVTSASNGTEALEKALQERFDLIISDVLMPQMDGFQLCRIVKTHPQLHDVPFVFYSATYTDPQDQAFALSLGADTFVAKPQDPRVLLAAVRALLRQRTDGRPVTPPPEVHEAVYMQNYNTRLIHKLEEKMLELEEAHRRLAASEAQYRRLFETAQDGVLLLDGVSGRIADVNPFLVTLLGRPYDDFLGKELWEIGVLEDREASQQAFTTLQREGYVRYEHLPLVTSDGQHLAVEFVSNVYAMDEQQVIQCNIRDITARHQLEAALAHEHADLLHANRTLTTSHAEIQRFYHTVSHELKTPLTVMREFVSIVLEGLAGPLTDQQREHLEIAKESCDQMKRGLNDLLDTTRADTGKLSLALRPMALGVVVARAVTMMAPAASTNGIRLRQSIAPQLPAVALDAQRITQVLTNLLNNAVKFTPAGGEVWVEVRLDPQRPTWVQVLVRDTGCGIEPENCQHIFDRLYQVPGADPLSTTGLGLGLYISQALVTLHGGTLQVQSRLGHGSTFAFSLPAVEGPEAPSSP
jgi:PAS domain S-box-containing protein